MRLLKSEPGSLLDGLERQGLRRSRVRKKHKRLDAICEKEFIRNRTPKPELNEVGGGIGDGDGCSEPRRSSRARRAPDILDSSPPPVKKRSRVEENGDNLRKKSEVSSVERVVDRKGDLESDPQSSDSGDLGEDEGWKSRLRARTKNGSLGSKERGGLSRSSSKKLFKDSNGFKEDPKSSGREFDEKKGGLGGEKSLGSRRKLFKDMDGFKKETKFEKKGGLGSGKSVVVKPKRPGRIKASRVLRDEDQDMESKIGKESREDDSKGDEMEVLENKDNEDKDMENEAEEDISVSIGVVDRGNEEEGAYVSNEHLTEQAETTEISDKQCEQIGGEREGETRSNDVEVTEITRNQQYKECHGVEIGVKPLDGEKAKMVDEAGPVLGETLGKPRIKEGRRCDLCGGGSDGKPPKMLIHDLADSENEGYRSGSSASEEHKYDIWDGFGEEAGWLGRLLGPILDRFGIARIWVHQQCAVWSPEVYFAGLGHLKNVRAALSRGKGLKCSRCGRPGATIGCRVDRCPKTYHLPCARINGCIFDHRQFLIACTDHRRHFQPQGPQRLLRIKKLKIKKLKLETRKLSNEASRKDVEAEEKWLENCGEDEEFLKRENKRLNRDLLRIAPVYIGGSNSENEKQFQGWESVAGLQDVVRSLKEVVILPLLYPEFFSNMGLTPPRGVLLHGYPGTGKTLVVRALIGSCARGDKRIAYFARKGADCLGKYVGDAERQLRLLFQVAEKSQPSIIFFDEIDGLAPCRTRQQDQTHSSVVSTLLALLDGIKSRGSVIVIGATNRPDAVDPALRRPGRFDREIYFPLPSVEDRAAILSLHTRGWPKPVVGPLLTWIARKTVGFAGADLQALCTQATIIALKRNCPLQDLLSAAEKKVPEGKRVPLPEFFVEERDWLEALSRPPPPCSRREAGMAANDVVTAPLQTHLVPCLLKPLSSLLVSLYLDDHLDSPSSVSKAASMIKDVIISSLNKKKVKVLKDRWWSYVHDLLQEASVLREIERKLTWAGLVIGEAKSGLDALTDEIDAGLKFDVAHQKPGFRTLIAGNPRSGQRHLASCLLHCFVASVEIMKVDLATISQEGHGDVDQGLTEILMKCARVGPCIVFMPRMDLWAIETPDRDLDTWNDSCTTNSGMSDSSSTRDRAVQTDQAEDLEEPGDIAPSASRVWLSFLEQVDSICLSTSLIILATSEVPVSELPLRVTQFFETDSSNCKISTTAQHSVPRFSIDIDGKFNTETVINSSAKELSRDLIQQFVQLIHHKTHSPKPSHGNSNTRVSAEDSDLKIPIPKVPNPNRNVKGKSSLLLAICTFGHQILRYPHFEELCWVTSKLREGPCTDINGPWKEWPFNACIVRPNNSMEIGYSTNDIKSKEKSGLVRGLIAVGLLAYRGVYTSLREVSLEVRAVLELLVGRIHRKIEGGKDRYQFDRVLSQVAYMEDMVNSWAYTLQSLEPDAILITAKPKPSTLVSLDDDHTSVDVSNGGFTESKVPENPDDDNIHCVDLTNKVGISPSDDCSAGKISNGFTNRSEVDRTSRPSKQSNGSHNSENFDGVNGSEDSNPSNETETICFYRCCPKCVQTLQNLSKKILVHKWESNGAHSTVEDVHEVVTSLSVNLLSRVRKFFANESFKHGDREKLFGSQKLETCRCKNSKSTSIAPMECSCHLRSNSRNPNPRDFDMKFIYKDGVMTRLDPDNDVSFHCKIEKLCLCSLIEWIVGTKKPLD